MGETTISKREYRFDNVKFLAILLVVVGHCIEMFMHSSAADMFSSLFIFIYAFHMPLFIFISGLFTKKMTSNSKTKVLYKASYLFAIGFLIKAIRAILRVLFHKNPDLGLLGASNIEWYLFVLGGFTILIYLLRKVPAYVMIPASIVLSCLIGLVNLEKISFIVNKNADFLYLYRFINFLPFYLVGYYLTPKMINDFVSKVYIKVIAAIIIVSSFILSFRSFRFVYQFRKLFTGRNPYGIVTKDGSNFANCFIQHRLAAMVISALLVISIIAIIPNVKIPIISHMGENTLSVYFYHSQVLFLLSAFGVLKWFTQLGENYGDPVCNLCVFVTAIILTFVFSLDIFMVPLKAVNKLICKVQPKILFACDILVFLICCVVTYMF